ncbi:universal stress protein [Atopobacter phocae]|uniref:universal stress protein n=1 Tax=Atopobacter phocae TaxID=136492 RepID=UPI0004B5BA85|nr:universal stress protein [Atopobacter phocae]
MLPQYKKILVPIDGSDEAFLAFKKAVTAARDNDLRKLVLAHIIDTRTLQTPTGFDGDFTDEIIQQTQNIFNEYTQYAKEHGVDQIETVIEYGSPKTIISKDLPKRYNADLIMMGATGLNAVERLLIGSVSSYVICHAICDVLIVRTNEEN